MTVQALPSFSKSPVGEPSHYQKYLNVKHRDRSATVVVAVDDGYFTFGDDAWLVSKHCGGRPKVINAHHSLELADVDIETLKVNGHRVVIVEEEKSNGKVNVEA